MAWLSGKLFSYNALHMVLPGTDKIMLLYCSYESNVFYTIVALAIAIGRSARVQ